MNKLLKVCGMRESGNIRQLIDLSPDMMGFIFYAKSPRYVSFIDKETIRMIPENIKKVGVFVNEPTDNIREIAERFGLDIIQLHGDETPLECRKIRNSGYKVIKAVSIETESDIYKTSEYEGSCDYFLFDTKTADYGGSGKRFDWKLLNKYSLGTPYLLSGGISLDLLPELKRYSDLPQMAGYDINSGFEIKPGIKDIEKIREFKKHIKNE